MTNSHVLTAFFFVNLPCGTANKIPQLLKPSWPHLRCLGLIKVASDFNL